MVVLQLFVALVILLASDGAQPPGNMCAYEGVEFCRHLKEARYQNEKAMGLLKHKCYDTDRIHLLGIDTLLLIILTRKDKEELLAVTVLALNLEAKELKQLNASCTAHKWQFECFLAVSKVIQATIELVEALIDIAQGEARRIAEQAYSEYKNGLQANNQSTIDLSIQLGASIPTRINESGLITWDPEAALSGFGMTKFD